MRIYTWQSAPNAQGWKRARTCDSTYVLHNVKTGKIIDKGFTYVDLPNESGWSFVEFDDEEIKILFNVKTEKYLIPEGFTILSKPNNNGWMSVRKNNISRFYNVNKKIYSSITAKNIYSIDEENWALIQLEQGYTFANPELDVKIKARFTRDYYASWLQACIEQPSDFKYLPSYYFKNDEYKKIIGRLQGRVSEELVAEKIALETERLQKNSDESE